MDPSFGRARHRLGTLYLRTGHGDRAAKQYKLARQEASLEDILRDVHAAFSAGPDASPKLTCYQVEALLCLQRPEEAGAVLGKNSVGTEEGRTETL